jgi:predicted DNA-binding transcriptional regulator YafY
MNKSFLLKLIVCVVLTTSFYSEQQTSKQQQIEDTLCKAIQGKKLIKFFYDDKYSSFSDWRIVEPHLIGDHKSTGNTTLVAWFLPTPQQLANGHSEGWGNYVINRIQDLQILEKTFQNTRPAYNPNDKRMKAIYCYLPKM